MKAFAVVPDKVKRGTAYSPLSNGWTLYKPEKLAADLGLDVGKVCVALERNGFSKAVRMREEVIRWKERLRAEEREITLKQASLLSELKKLRQRQQEVQEQLGNVRNLLRLEREDGATRKAFDFSPKEAAV